MTPPPPGAVDRGHGNNPSKFRGDDLPVEQVSWNEAQELVRRLNERDPARDAG